MSIIPGQDLIDLYSHYNIYPYDVYQLIQRLCNDNSLKIHEYMLIIKKYYSYTDFMKDGKFVIYNCFKCYFPEVLTLYSDEELYDAVVDYISLSNYDKSCENYIIEILTQINRYNSEIINDLRELLRQIRYRFNIYESYQVISRILDNI